MEILCLKAAYFRQQAGLPAYQKRPTLRQLGGTFSDVEELCRLVPGREAEADQLLDAPELKEFWYALTPKNGQSFRTSMMDQLLRRAIANFAAWLNTRQMLNPEASGALRLQAERSGSHAGDSVPSARPAVDVLRQYREHIFPPSLSFVPEEWHHLLESFPAIGVIILRDRAGTVRRICFTRLALTSFRQGTCRFTSISQITHHSVLKWTSCVTSRLKAVLANTIGRTNFELNLKSHLQPRSNMIG